MSELLKFATFRLHIFPEVIHTHLLRRIQTTQSVYARVILRNISGFELSLLSAGYGMPAKFQTTGFSENSNLKALISV